MNIYPAIDLRGGRCVRLLQGSFDQETRYDADPLSLALEYEQAGAPLLHLVDLDGAKGEGDDNLDTIERLATGLEIPIQCGGGIRALTDAERLWNCGVQRVVIGSLAVREPQTISGWLRQQGSDALCIALDVRREEDEFMLATHGWVCSSEVSLWQGVEALLESELKHVLCTDIGRDGMLNGPNIALYRSAVECFPQLAWQASGGVSSLDDFSDLIGSGVDGVVVGKALLEGRFSLTEALECSQGA